MKERCFSMGAVLLVLVAMMSLVSLSQPVAPKGIIIEPPDVSGLSVRIWVDKGAYTVGETIQVHFEVNEDAYVYVYNIDAVGEVRLIFPNYWSRNNYVGAGEHVIPDSSAYRFRVVEPAGTEYLQAIAAKQPVGITPQFQPSVPFPFLGGDPEAFKQEMQGQIMGIIPEPQWAEDWTSFEVVSGTVPAYGTLVVNSVPSGAWITLDGSYVGYTPRTLYVRQGYHQVVISKEGYRDWRRSVLIIGGLTRTINATLEPAPSVNRPPVATFTATPGFSTWVRFDAAESYDPDGTIVSYSWDFGDRSSGAKASDWHWYSAPGTYTVTLTVTDDEGATDTEVRTVQVGPTNQPPVAAFTVSPPSPGIGEWVRFDASASYDSDGSVTSYSWDFGDRTSGTGVSEWHRYTAPGTYTVTLTVTDDEGVTDTEIRTVQVGPTNQPPVASFTVSPPSPGVGEWVQFDASASYDSDGGITSYNWDFGDRSSGTGVSEWHRYTAPGTYTVTLTVTDDDGATDTEVRAVQVGPTNQPPVASFTYSPTNPAVGAQVLFQGNASYDPDGNIVSYNWNFGDGRTSGPSSASAVYYQYTAPGTYTVTLTVADDDGATDTEVRTVQVGAMPQVGPVGYWRFNEGSGPTATDSSGYGNHGTIRGASWVSGSPDGSMALSFDGETAYVGVSDSSSLNPTSALTIEAWINPSELPSKQRMIVEKPYTSHVPPYYQYLLGTLGSDVFCSFTVSGQGIRAKGSSGSLRTGQWYHVACVYDGRYVKVYVNGALQGSNDVGAGTISSYNTHVNIGKHGNVASEKFRGLIDEVRIHNRALNASEFNLLPSVAPTNQRPVAAFTYSPPTPEVGEQIVLNASSSYDPDGTIVSYLWDLDGDGSDDTSGQIAYVRYYSAGIAQIRLTVVDNAGLSSRITQQITVGAGGGVPGGPPMGGNPGIFVWGSDTWHVTVNAGSSWTTNHSYRLELRTDGTFRNVNQSTSGGVAPLGIVPTPTEGGRTLLFEGSLQSGSVDYTFSMSNAKSIWLSLKLDMDGDGDLEESPSFVYLRHAMVHPPATPFVVGLPKGSSGPLVPSMNFQIGRALQYTSAVRFIMWLTDIATLEGY